MELLTATLDELLIDSTPRDRLLKKRLLENLPMGTVFELLIFSEKELLARPGIGPAMIAYLKFCLIANGFRLREDNETVITWINTLADKAGGYPLTLLNLEEPTMNEVVYLRNVLVDALYEQDESLMLSFLDGLTKRDIAELTMHSVDARIPDYEQFVRRAAAWGHPLLERAA
jgi:hypothetical protein